MHYQPLCQHYRRAPQVCVTRGCTISNCFCCAQCKRNHPRTCEFMEYKKFIYQIHKRQGLTKQEFCRYEERVQNTFNTLIKALKKQFIQFRQEFERFNATEEIITFYDKIAAKKQKQTTGQQASQLIGLEIPRMIDYRIRDQVQMKRIQNNIFAVHSYVIKKLRPYYALREKFQQVQVDFPEINELKRIEEKYVDRGTVTKGGLLKGDLSYFQFLLKDKIYNIKLLYRASQHNFSCQKFHQLCDGKNNTLVLAMTQFGKLVGMWCPFEWKSPDKWVYLTDVDIKDAFLFSYQEGLKGMRFDPVKRQFAIGLHKDYGPIFGDDFVIYDKSNGSNSCWSNFPDVYNYKQKPFEHNDYIIKMFTGTKDHFQKFNIVEWEVYKINLTRRQDLEVSWMEIYKKI